MATETFDGLVGQAVEQLWITGDCRLVFDSTSEGAEPRTYVDVTPSAQYRSPAGDVTPIDPIREPDRSGSVLRLLRQKVTIAGSDHGVLTLRFADGSEISKPPDDHYESWSVVIDGRAFQCLPGGEVTSW